MKIYNTPSGYLIVAPAAQLMYWIYNTHVSVEPMNELAYDGLEEGVWDIGVMRMLDNAMYGAERLLTNPDALKILMALVAEKVG